MRTATWCLMAVLAALAARVSYGEAPTSAPASQPSNTFTISKEITRATGPVRADGTIDYVAALNAQMSQGVTPANNAAAGLVRALGPWAFGTDDARRAKLLRTLGIKPADVAGDHYVGPEEYVDQNGQGDEVAKSREPLDKLNAQPWTAAEYPMLGRWIALQDAAITHIAAAVDLPKFYLPLVPKTEPSTMIGETGDGLTALRSAGRALAYRAMFRLATGDVEGFRSDLRSLSRLARHVASRPMYIDQLVASGLDALAIAAYTGAATSERLTAAQAKAVLADLDATPPMPSAAMSIDVGERYMMLDLLGLAARHGWVRASQIVAGKGPDQRLLFAGLQTRDWDAVFRKVNGWYDRYVSVIAAPTQAERDGAAKELDRETAKLQQRASGPLAVLTPPEDRLVLITMPSLRGATVIPKQHGVACELSRVALALSAFLADHGKYPVKLADLVPVYLPKLPSDPFAAGSAELIYDVNALGGYRLASVGENGKDDRQRAPEGFKVDDIIVLGGKQPPPPPTPKDEFEIQLDAADAPPAK